MELRPGDAGSCVDSSSSSSASPPPPSAYSLSAQSSFSSGLPHAFGLI